MRRELLSDYHMKNPRALNSHLIYLLESNSAKTRDDEKKEFPTNHDLQQYLRVISCITLTAQYNVMLMSGLENHQMG